MQNPKSSHVLFTDFPVGTRVKVVSHAVDFYFFYGEAGVIVSNTGKYLGISVRLDAPRGFKSENEFEDGYIQTEFGFNPNNLEVLD
mgnify:FL=1